MEITETTLYPRYLHNSLPSDGFGTIVGVMVEVRENNTIIVDCEEDGKKENKSREKNPNNLSPINNRSNLIEEHKVYRSSRGD